MNFIRYVEQFITRHHLIEKLDKVIVGLSGGADSVALLTVLCDAGYDVIATHCNFHLRGEESMRDEAFCRKLCREKSVKLLIKDFDVDTRRRNTGESLEMACRSLRYEWWNSMIKGGMATVIAVGHHREDNIETFFLNLFRGSSLAGLKGMLPRNGSIVRPLLECTKEDILAYLRDCGLDYMTDSTNSDNYYKRNRIRNCLIPLIQREFPGAIDSIAQTISHLRDNYSLYREYRSELKNRYLDNEGGIDLYTLVAKETDPRMALYEVLSDDGVNMTVVDNILERFKTESGKIYYGKEKSWLLDRGRLIQLEESDQKLSDEISVDLTVFPFRIRRLSPEEFLEMKCNHTLDPVALYADSAIMNGNANFTMRSWRNGDRMRPFGLKGSKLLSDIFSDAKMSLNEKKDVKVICRNSDIIWIPGLRCSSLFPVTEKSENVLEIVYIPLCK